jgi:hypothetical protein
VSKSIRSYATRSTLTLPDQWRVSSKVGWSVLARVRWHRIGLAMLTFSVIALAAVGPVWLLLTGLSPAGYDALPHLYRVAALDQSIRAGALYPRWFDDFIYGYGYPIFYYYAPLFYYVVEAFHLVGLNLIVAVNAALIASRLVGGLASFNLAKSITGLGSAGLVASVAFLLLPLQFTDLYERSSYPEALALNLFPAAFWGVHQVVRHPSRRAIGGASLALAALILAHQTSAFVSGAALAAFAGGELLATWWSAARRSGTVLVAGARLAAVGGLGLGLSAFFWLPAIFSRDWVLGLAGSVESVAYFTQQLRPLIDLSQRTFFFQQQNHGYERLGLVQLSLAALGFLVALLVPGRARPPLALFGLLAFGLCLSMTSLARQVWEAMPFVTLMQDPFRVGLTIGVGSALLVGGLLRLRPRWVGWLAGATAVALLAASTLGGLSPSLARLRPDAIDPGSFARTEMFAKYPEIGTVVPVSQFLPRWVSRDPATLDRSLARDPAQPDLDGPAQVSLENAAPGHYALKTSSGAPFSFLLHGFYFPAWLGRLDGQPVAVEPFGERGLVSVAVPPGEHALELDFGWDGVSTVAAMLSIVSLGVVVGLLVARSTSLMALVPIAVVGVVGGLLVARAASGPQSGIVNAASRHFSDGIDLAGWSSHPAVTAAGETELDVDLYWFARREVSTDDEVLLELSDAPGHVPVTYHKPPRWGSTPTSTWQANELVHDQHLVPLPGGLTAGSYQLGVGLRQVTDTRSTVQWVGTVQLSASQSPAAPEPAHPFHAQFADGLALVGYDASGIGSSPRFTVEPGREIALRLYWDVVDDSSQDEVISIFLADDRGNKYGVQDTYPPHDLEFTAAWRKGSHHVQDFSLPVPPELRTGEYSLAVEVYDLATGQRQPIVPGTAGVGTTRVPLLTVKRPGPIQPIVPGRIEADFGGEVALLGHDVSVGADRAVHVTLHWQSIGIPRHDYTVFAHLVDASGKLVAQHDAPPRAGSDPTSTWDPGEVVDDELTIDAGPGPRAGAYSLRIGLYEPSTGRRLPLASGGDSLTIDTVQLP